MPGRARPVGRGERLAERVAPVCGVVATAVAQVDAADESDVPLGPSRVTQYDGLLMVRTAGAHPHVEQAFSARRSDLLTEVTVLAFAELEAVQVRTPDQPLDDDSALGRRTQHLSDLATGAFEPFVWIAAPVGEQQQVARLLGADGLEQFTEVHRAVNEGSYLVPRRPRHSPGRRLSRRVAGLPRSPGASSQSASFMTPPRDSPRRSRHVHQASVSGRPSQARGWTSRHHGSVVSATRRIPNPQGHGRIVWTCLTSDPSRRAETSPLRHEVAVGQAVQTRRGEATGKKQADQELRPCRNLCVGRMPPAAVCLADLVGAMRRSLIVSCPVGLILHGFPRAARWPRRCGRRRPRCDVLQSAQAEIGQGCGPVGLDVGAGLGQGDGARAHRLLEFGLDCVLVARGLRSGIGLGPEVLRARRVAAEFERDEVVLLIGGGAGVGVAVLDDLNLLQGGGVRAGGGGRSRSSRTRRSWCRWWTGSRPSCRRRVGSWGRAEAGMPGCRSGRGRCRC